MSEFSEAPVFYLWRIENNQLIVRKKLRHTIFANN